MPFEAVAGVLLAGGRARRMGGADKGLLALAGKPILAHVIERAAPQVQTLLLSANGDPARFEAFGLPVAADVIEGQAGPLAGVLTGLEWAAENECEWLASFAVDAPFLPLDLVRRLAAAVTREGADLACAASNGRAHPVFGLWPVALKDALRRAMVEEGMRKVDRWTARYRLASVAFESEPVDPFFNANRPEDIEQAEKLLACF
jgi:molybdopterin-guanine dinucleotide biosynthesis protein A